MVKSLARTVGTVGVLVVADVGAAQAHDTPARELLPGAANTPLYEPCAFLRPRVPRGKHLL